MIKKFAYFKNCVYLCTQKHFTVILSFFDIFFSKNVFQISFAWTSFIKKEFRKHCSDIENDFQKDVEDDFRKESSIKEKKQKKFILISLSYTISLVSY